MGSPPPMSIVSTDAAGDRVVVHDAHRDEPTTAFALSRLSLSPTGRELDSEFAWTGPFLGGSAAASVFYRKDPGHIASLPDDKGVAMRWSRRF